MINEAVAPARLPFTPRPIPTELVSSWLLRVAAGNCVELSELLQGLASRYGRVLANSPIDYGLPDAAAHALSKFCRVAPEKIRALDLRNRTPHLNLALLLTCLFAADKALDLGRGGISRLSVLTGLSRTTITKAVEELSGRGKLVSPGEGRVRWAGGGRKKVEGMDPGVRDWLGKILEETTAGDPMSLLRWISQSTRTIAEELTRLGRSSSA